MASNLVSEKPGKEQRHQITPPSIFLSIGGGAIRGIGEKFAANPVTGTGSMTVPITTSPGRSGFGPQLSFSYHSGSGKNPFGFGWSLSLPSIIRKIDKGLPLYLDSRAVLSFGELFDRRHKKLFEEIVLGDFSKVAVGNGMSEQDATYLRRMAVEALANIGDEETLSRLRV